MPRRGVTRHQRPRSVPRRVAAAVAAVALLGLAACGTVAGASARGQGPPGSSGQLGAAAANPGLDPGSALGGEPAPDFRLVNQFGQPMSLSQFRGRVVLLGFEDSECTTV